MAPDGNRADTDAPVRAVLLDALGTLVGLRSPAPHLVAGLAAEGIVVSPARAAAAMGAEMAHYRAEHHRGGTPAGLAALRAECAAVLGDALGPPASDLGTERLQVLLLGALRFFAYPEVPGALAQLRAAGLRLVVCSNWDLSLHEVLAATGLDGLVDGVVISAVEGVAKPDPALVARALALAGDVAPAQAVLVGDSVAADVRGALAAGVHPVLVRRAGDEIRSADGDDAPPAALDVLPDLAGLAAFVLYPRRSR